MKTKFHIKERLYLMNVLPKENSLVDYQLKKGLIKKLEITDSDKELYGFSVEDGGGSIKWDPKKDFENPAEFELSDQERDYARNAVESASDGTHNDEYWMVLTGIYEKLGGNKV